MSDEVKSEINPNAFLVKYQVREGTTQNGGYSIRTKIVTDPSELIALSAYTKLTVTPIFIHYFDELGKKELAELIKDNQRRKKLEKLEYQYKNVARELEKLEKEIEKLKGAIAEEK
jgi:hypothetical protein